LSEGLVRSFSQSTSDKISFTLRGSELLQICAPVCSGQYDN